MVGLNNLERIYLNKNQIKIIGEKAFFGLERLEYAFLNDNKLSELNYNNSAARISPFYPCKYLKKLDFSNNNISNFFQEWKYDKPDSLILRHNSLTTINVNNIKL